MMSDNSIKSFLTKLTDKRNQSKLFAISGAICVSCVILMCMIFVDALPALTFKPDTPKARVVEMMDALCQGDFTEAEKYMLNHPDLGIDHDPSDETSALIWNAFINSFSYTLVGDCCATEDGLSQTVSFTRMDISAVTANLRERAQSLLTNRVEEASDVSEIYDENNEYRADIVKEVLLHAVEDALAEDCRFKTSEIVVNLRYQNGQWWIIADQALLNSLFGDALFYTS